MIRPAQAADAGAIAALWNAAIRDTSITFTSTEHTQAGLLRLIAARGPLFLVAEIDGGVAGFATAAPFRDGPGYAHTLEHSIQLAAEMRGAGLGRALMARLGAAAAGQGAHSLIAAVSGENPGAIAFHARLGFAEIGRLTEAGRKFDRWMDLVLMQRML